MRASWIAQYGSSTHTKHDTKIVWLIFPPIESSLLYPHKLYWPIIDTFCCTSKFMTHQKSYLYMITRRKAKLSLIKCPLEVFGCQNIQLPDTQPSTMKRRRQILQFPSKNYHTLIAKTTKFLLNVIAMTMSRIRYTIKARQQCLTYTIASRKLINKINVRRLDIFVIFGVFCVLLLI